MYTNKHGLSFKNPIHTYKPIVIEVRTVMPDGDGDVVRFEMKPDEFPKGTCQVTSFTLNEPAKIKVTNHPWMFVAAMLQMLGDSISDGVVGDKKEKPTTTDDQFSAN